MSVSPAVKSPLPAPVFYRLSRDWSGRFEKVCPDRTKRADFARVALFARIEQVEAQGPAVTPVIARQIAEAEKLGLNVERVLTNAIAAQARAAASVFDHGPFPHRD